MIRGVIFDLDGVLVTTDELHFRAWARMAEEEGIPFDRTVNERLRGVSRMDSLEIILERAPRQYSEEEKQELADRKNGYYRRSLRELTADALLPGALEMLRALRQRGVKLAIASSSRNAPLINERLGLEEKVDAAVDGNDISHSKPHPEIFQLAARRLGLPPRECLVVEDAQAGIEAGRKAGTAVFGIGDHRRLPDVERLAPSLADVSPDRLLAAGDGS
ncbi:MAG: beta-phosphoglucomutase [Candidatus Brocadiia bacterium]